MHTNFRLRPSRSTWFDAHPEGYASCSSLPCNQIILCLSFSCNPKWTLLLVSALVKKLWKGLLEKITSKPFWGMWPCTIAAGCVPAPAGSRSTSWNRPSTYCNHSNIAFGYKSVYFGWSEMQYKSRVVYSPCSEVWTTIIASISHNRSMLP